jgi:hypothetical protein
MLERLKLLLIVLILILLGLVSILILAKSTMFFSKNCRPAIRVSINGILNLAHIPARAKSLVFLSF